MKRPARSSEQRATPHPAPAFRWSAPASGSGRALTLAAWLAMACYAATVLAIIAGPHPVGDVFTETDFYGAYGLGARALQHGHLDAARYAVVGPLHEMLLALTGFVVRDLFVAAELISALSMTVALWAWHRLLRARAGAGVALVATVFMALNGQFVRYGYSATTDALALALQALALLLLCGGGATARRAAAAGAVAALAFLTRYSAAGLLPAGVVALLLGWTGTPREQRLRAALGFAAGFAAPVLPWMAYSLASGAHLAFQLHHNIAYDVFARSRGIPWDTYQREMQSQFPTPWSVLARDPGAVAARMLFNVFDHFRLDALRLAGAPLALSALAGALFAWRDGTLVRLRAILFAGAWLFLALVPAFHSERYSLALLPLWAAFGATAFASPLLALSIDAGAARRIWLKPLLAIVPAALALQASIALQERTLYMLPREVLQVAREVRPLLREGDRVIARKPHFAWHAGLTAEPFPFVDSLDQLAAVAREKHVRWLYFSWPEAEMRPAFSYLLDTSAVVPGLTARAVTSEHPAVLYEIGPGFGADPAWLADPEQVTVHRSRARVLIDRTDWRTRVYLALYERGRGRFTEAQALLDDAVKSAPGELDLLILYGDNLARTGSAGAARSALDRASAIAPGDPRIALARGWAELADANPGGAAQQWRALTGYPTDEPTLRRMREVFVQSHDLAAAGEVAQRMADLGMAP